MWQNWFSRRRHATPAASEQAERRPADRHVSATLRLHAATAQTSGRLQVQPDGVHWGQQPSLYKRYPTAEHVALSEQVECAFPDTLTVLQPGAGQSAPAPWNLATLARLCFYSYGLTAQQTLPTATLTLRAAPSAGALYPAELYLALRGADGVRDGLYHYAVADHALELLRPADWLPWLATAVAHFPALTNASAVILLSSMWQRSAWKYGARAFRYCLQDCGHLAGNLALTARALGYAPALIFHFLDDPAERLLGLSPAGEAVQLLIALQGAPAHVPVTPTAEPAPLALIADPPPQLQAGAIQAQIMPAANATRLHEPATVARQRACPPLDPRRAAPTGAQTLATPPTVWPATGVSLCQSLSERRSAHRFEPQPLPAETLSIVLSALQLTHASDCDPAGHLLDLYLIVNRVAGVPPGAYRYDPGGGLAMLRSGSLAEWAMHLSFDQSFCGEAAAVIFFIAPLEEMIERCGDRVYRQLHLEAGVRAEAAYLAAHALGIGCTGIGAFYDLETVRFFHLPGAAAVIYELAIGAAA